MSEHDPCAVNQAMWNETAAVHERVSVPDLLANVGRTDFCTFDRVERQVFEELGLHQKDVAQLACNNARELISVKKAGARRCVGFDISEAFIEQGQRLAHAGHVDIELVRTNIYDIPVDYSNSFDVVYVTVGALGWLPDVYRFFIKVAELLRAGGQLFLYEMHPALFLYDETTTAPHDPRISRSYFRTEPVLFENCQDYFDRSSVIQSPSYWYQHTLGAILSAVLASGLSLRRFEEYPHDVSGSYAEFEKQQTSIPMSFSLVAQKARWTSAEGLR